MAFEQNNTARHFETMLRGHLVHAGRLASPCSGFDPELANAYLEAALGNQLRATYESHLAACASCRQALVMLQKMELSDVVAVRAEASHRGWWESIREALAGPTWGLGLAAAAGAIVIAVGVYALRRPASTAPSVSQEFAIRAGSEGVPVVSSSTVVIAPAPSPVGLNRTELRREIAGTRARVTTVSENNLPAVGDASSTALAQAPAVPKQENEIRAVAPPVGETQVAAATQTESRTHSESRKEDSRQDTYRPPAPAAQTQERRIDDKGARRLAPRESANSRPQATPRPRSNEDENFRPLMRKVRDKSFRFDRWVWIDQAYMPELRLPKTRLSRGTPEFDRVLAENPSLAPFFDLGEVIVVWQGRVYEVRK